MPTVEDYFDDETDLPLPSSSKAHIPNTGMRGALLEEITDDNELDMDMLADQGRGEYGADSHAPPPSENAKGKLAVRDDPGDLRPSGQVPQMNPNTPMGGFMGDMMKLQEAEEERLAKIRRQFGNTTVHNDPSVFKNWNTVYPLYFDAKVSINDGRRVARKAALWWPLATHIARACATLGIPCVLEPEKTHPADWENPGRVKVQIKKDDGSFANPIAKNRTQLYNVLSQQMQRANPTLVPQPVAEKPKAAVEPAPKAKAKNAKGHGGKAAAAPKAQPARLPTRPPAPPHPFPALDARLPLHSPLAATGVATAAVKRDLETEKENKKKGISMGPSEEGEKQKMPKMKRVVVRGKR